MPDDPVEMLAKKYGPPDPVEALAAKYGGASAVSDEDPLAGPGVAERYDRYGDFAPDKTQATETDRVEVAKRAGYVEEGGPSKHDLFTPKGAMQRLGLAEASSEQLRDVKDRADAFEFARHIGDKQASEWVRGLRSDQVRSYVAQQQARMASSDAAFTKALAEDPRTGKPDPMAGPALMSKAIHGLMPFTDQAIPNADAALATHGFIGKLAGTGAELGGALIPIGQAAKIVGLPMAQAIYGAVGGAKEGGAEGAVGGAASGYAFGALAPPTANLIRSTLARLPAVQQSAILQRLSSAVAEATSFAGVGRAIHPGAGLDQSVMDVIVGAIIGGASPGAMKAEVAKRLQIVKAAPTAIPPRDGAKDLSTQEIAAAHEAYIKAGGDPAKIKSPERIEKIEGITDPEIAKVVLEATPPETRPDGSIAGGYKPTADAIRDGDVQPEAVETVKAATASKISTFTSGVDEATGNPFTIGVAPDGRVVEVQGEPGATAAEMLGLKPKAKDDPAGARSTESVMLDFGKRLAAATSDAELRAIQQEMRDAGLKAQPPANPKEAPAHLYGSGEEMSIDDYERANGPAMAEAEAARRASRGDGKRGARVGKAEPAGAEPEGTSIKNRVVNAEREARGVAPLSDTPAQSFEGWRDAATKAIAENPNKPAEVIADLKRTGRAHTPTEVAILTEHRVNLNRAVKASDAKVIEAAERGDLDALASAKAESARLRNEDFETSEIVGKGAGAEAARALGSRRMVLDDAYELLSMETQRRVENDGKPLTEKQAAETKALHERLAKAIAERDAYQARLADVEARRSSRSAPPRGSKEYGRANKVVTREMADAAADRIREKLGRLTAGIDPTILADLAVRGAFHIEAGARSFAEWAKAMTEDFGARVAPHLRSTWDEAQKQLGRDARSLRALKTRTRGQTTDLETRVELGVLDPPTRRTVARDAEAVRLEANLEMAKKAWREALFRDQLANRTRVQKVAAAALETSTTARALMTSFDFSAVLRQGGFVAFAHPIRAAKAMIPMFRAFASKGGQARAEAEIALRPNYSLAKRSGLFLSEHGDVTLSKMEEAYMSRWAERIPVVAASQRAYTTFLNRLRVDSFDAMLGNLSRAATPTPKEARAVANYVNVATGRGGGAKLDTALTALNGVFFSPRLVASRFQLLAEPLLGFNFGGGSMRTRMLFAQEYARYLAAVGVVYGLANLTGAETSNDPTSSEFGKPRFGATRVDPLSGLAQATVLLSRLALGEKTSVNGKTSPIRGGVRYGQPTAFDTISNFLRTKLAPIPSSAVDLLSGEDVAKNPVTVTDEALSLVTPLTLSDIYKAMREQGVPKGAALGLLSVFGMGLQTHASKSKEPKRRPSGGSR